MRQEDYSLLQRLRQDGVLQDVDAEKMMGINEPTGLILCSDGHQRADINSHFSQIWESVKAEEHIHEIKFAGAHLFCARSHLVSHEFNEHLFIIDQVNKGIKLGKIVKRLLIVGHWGCGMAKVANLSLVDALALQLKGVEHLRKAFDQLKISAELQVDYDGEKKRTYHVDHPLAQGFLEKYSEFDYTNQVLFDESVGANA